MKELYYFKTTSGYHRIIGILLAMSFLLGCDKDNEQNNSGNKNYPSGGKAYSVKAEYTAEKPEWFSISFHSYSFGFENWTNNIPEIGRMDANGNLYYANILKNFSILKESPFVMEAEVPHTFTNFSVYCRLIAKDGVILTDEEAKQANSTAKVYFNNKLIITHSDNGANMVSFEWDYEKKKYFCFDKNKNVLGEFSKFD